MKSKIIALALFAATAATVAAYPQLKGWQSTPIEPIEPVAGHLTQQHSKIEVVFVLDTTGSMSGLIAAAKEKIWSIASTMAAAQPAPEIRMGLVAYRDRGDDYVTRVIDLSSDLDSMYARLMDFQADGGGDGPESVNQALDDAINRISWSQDPDAYKVVFLVGDAPPHMDYQDDVKYPVTLKLAREGGIVVNTIQCGLMPQTTRQWQQMARLAQGRYFQVDQAGSAVAIATPFDAEIASLAAALDETRLYYGDREAKARASRKLAATEKLYAESSPAALARRGAFNASVAGAASFAGDNELIDDVASGRVDLDAIETEALPEPLQAMAPAERERFVQGKLEKREALRQRIDELSGKRDNFLADEIAGSGGAEESLDYQIFETVREQVEAKGFALEADAPKY